MDLYVTASDEMHLDGGEDGQLSKTKSKVVPRVHTWAPARRGYTLCRTCTLVHKIQEIEKKCRDKCAVVNYNVSLLTKQAVLEIPARASP